jgi:hypothetical protein
MSFPQITNKVAVADFISQLIGNEYQQIGRLLNDVVEDGAPHCAEAAGPEFGTRGLVIVEVCSDGTPDSTEYKEPLAKRMVVCLAHLAVAGEDAYFQWRAW